MKELLKLLYRFRNFLLFLLLQGICFWLIINHNTYQRITFLTSAGGVVGNMLEAQNWVATRWNLKDENERLIAENAQLRNALSNYIRENNLADSSLFSNNNLAKKDSLEILSNTFQKLDSSQLVALKQYQLIPATVIKHSWLADKNFLTINKGKEQGIGKGMGVITDSGIVGKVEAVSDSYATIRTILHTDYEVASVIKRNQVLATSKWDGKNYETIKLLNTTTQDIKEGDTIVTYTENILYPAGFTVGYIEKINTDNSQAFNDIDVKLSTDFSRISYVYVVRNDKKAELDSLQRITTASPL